MDNKKTVGSAPATKRFGKKAILLSLAVLLVFGAVVGGTMAWLVTRTEPVRNTFTYGDIDIDLEEDDTGDGDQDPNTNEYEMVPGAEIDKNPVVTVEADSVDSWLFVKLEKSANFDDFMTYTIADGWTALEGYEGVYYRQTTRSANDQEFHVLKDDKVYVKDNVTKEMLNALDDSDPANYPTLTITAYAVQKEGFDTAAAAWAQVLATETP